MAIDTREKRMSMLNFGDGSTIHTLFEADGTIDLDDKQHLLDLYSGIPFAGPTPPVPPPVVTGVKPRFGQPIIADRPVHANQPVAFSSGFVECVRSTGPTFGARPVRTTGRFGATRIQDAIA